MVGAVQNVTLTFNSWNNTGTDVSAANLGILLQAPAAGSQGISALEVMSNACKTAGTHTFTMTDAGTANAVPNPAGGGSCFGTGSLKPTTRHFTGFTLDNFSSPGPGTTYQRAEPDSNPAGPGTNADTSNGKGTFAVAFGGMASANGVWRLYITSVGGTSGSIANWTLTVTTAGAGSATTTTVTGHTPNPSFTSSSPVTLTAQVTSSSTVNTGNVLFHSNGIAGGAGAGDLGTVAVNGSGIATLSNVQFTVEGAHQIIATYQGGGSFAASTSAAVTHQVIKTTTPQASPPVGTVGFCNTGGLTLPTTGAALGQGPGNPYPSAIVVSGVTGIIQELKIHLNGYTSTNPSLTGLVLAGPNGKTLEFDSLTGGPNTVSNLNLVFDDQAATQALPNTVSFTSQSYKPTAAATGFGDLAYCQTAVCNSIIVSEPAPTIIDRAAPQGNPARTLLGQFAGSSANGTWKLFSQLSGNPVTQTINNWCLNFTMTNGTATTTSVVGTPNPQTTGSAVSFDATVTDTVSPGIPVNAGTVTFSDSVSGSNLGTIAVANGHAVLSGITSLVEGNHIITASYNGTASLGFSSGTVNQRINNPTVQNPANTTRYCNQLTGINTAANGVQGAGFPYPSNVIIANQPGTINAVEIDLNSYTSTAPQSLQSLLVGPCQGLGCSIDFFSNPLEVSTNGTINLAFKDAFASTIPANNAIPLSGGNFKPYSRVTGNIYPPTAPAGPYNYAAPAGTTTLNQFFANGDPNGTWSYFTFQNLVAGNAGTIGSWCVNLTVNPPVLAVTKTHTGPGAGNAFVAGQAGSYTIHVTNNGPGSTAGATVTVSDTMPSGLTIQSVVSGNEWNCTSSTATVLTCTTNSALAATQSYSNLTVNFNVAVTAPATVTNTATASGFSMTTGNGTDGPTTVIHPPILSLSNTDTGSPLHTFTQGDTGKSATFTLQNGTAVSGAGPTTSVVTVTFNISDAAAIIPQSVVPSAGWNCGAVAATFSCTSTGSPALAAGASATFQINFNVSATASSPQSIQASSSGGGGNAPTNTDTLTIIQLPDLTINKTHTGTFAQGGTGAFTLTVTNSGTGPTTAAYSVTDTMPTGLTISSTPTGTGWNCAASTTTVVSCTRSTVIAASAAAPAITVNVNIAPTSPTSVANTATVSGGGEAVTTNNSSTDTVPVAQTASSMTANPGTTPQSATISTAFANPLAVTVRDASNNPVAGVSVTFTAPGAGASGIFSNSTATITVATNASGVASAPFTANSTAGGPYTVTAAAAGLTTVNFSLTNSTGAASSMTANAGTTPQSATINTAFANALAVTVRDAGSNPVSGVNVTFTAPGAGASGLFSNSTNTITVATNASGVASAPFTANATTGGPYNVTAAASGLTTVNFSLTNTAGAASSMTANAGTTPQSATINTAFANALAVTVRDAGSNPISGVNVTFTAPGAGASGLFSNSTATITVATNASGIASAPFTANGTAGGPYTVTAAASGLTTVNFSLTNTAGTASSMTANAGTTPQSATINTAFANALAVTVKDAGSNPVSGVNVTFSAPGSGASGLFSNSTTTITVATNASGIASAPFTANATAGGPYTVTAAASGLTTVNFSLTNTAGAASSMTANPGTTPQSAAVNTAFANALAVTVKDAGSNPISGVNVTFTAPGAGASGLFSNSTNTITVATNASGVASAPFTANGTAGGPYNVTAAASGLTTVNFSLTNTGTGPVVTQNPASQGVVAGNLVTFTAAATGTPTPTVQWQISTNGGGSFTDIPGATTTTLSFTTQVSDNGNQYRAVFTNIVSSATTTAATLTVFFGPTVTLNPVSQTVNSGSLATFTAAATGNPTPTVQWQISTDGGATFQNIAGATLTTLSFTALASQNGNRFRAVFTNTVGSATTTAATLTVNSAAPLTVTAFRVLWGSQSFNVIGSSRNRLPWQVTGIQVVFSAPVTSANVNSLSGVNPTGFSGLGTNTLTWSISPISLGQFTAALAGSGPNAISAGANSLGGGAGFMQLLRVLYGDYNDDGVVNASDLSGVQLARSAPYNIFADLNGDGVVDVADIQIVRLQIGNALP